MAKVAIKRQSIGQRILRAGLLSGSALFLPGCQGAPSSPARPLSSTAPAHPLLPEVAANHSLPFVKKSPVPAAKENFLVIPPKSEVVLAAKQFLPGPVGIRPMLRASDAFKPQKPILQDAPISFSEEKKDSGSINTQGSFWLWAAGILIVFAAGAEVFWERCRQGMKQALNWVLKFVSTQEIAAQHEKRLGFPHLAHLIAGVAKKTRDLEELLDSPTPAVADRFYEDDRYPGVRFGNFSGEFLTAAGKNRFFAALADIFKSLPQAFPINEICIVESFECLPELKGENQEKVRAIFVVPFKRLVISVEVLRDAQKSQKLLLDIEHRIAALSPQEMGRTVRAIARLKAGNLWEPDQIDINPNGTFLGRRIIGRNIKVTDGVYLSGASGRPAIFVDAEDPRLIAVYQQVKQKIDAMPSPRGFKQVLQAVFLTVSSAMPYRKVDKWVMQKLGIQTDEIASLGEYLDVVLKDDQVGGGVCAHQALLTCFILESLVRDGILKGRVSFDRNNVVWGAHAWARFIPEGQADEWIVDIAQKVWGKKESLENWPYAHYRNFFEALGEPF